MSERYAQRTIGTLLRRLRSAPLLELIIHYNVSQEDIVKEIELFCTYKVGDSVELGPFARRRIVGRKWNFQTGTMGYLLEGNKPGRELSMDQQELTRRIEAAGQPLG